MAKRRYEQVCIRFHLDCERDRRLFKILDDLDVSTYKSKNLFILNAIEAYIDGIGEEKVRNSSSYVTREEFEEVKEQLITVKEQVKSEIQKELYQQIVCSLAGSTMANIALQTGNINGINRNGEKNTEDRNKCEPDYNLLDTEAVLDDVMKWS